MVSFQSNQYIQGFLKKRFTKIGIPYLLMLAMYILVVIILGRGSMALFIQSFINGYPVSNSWYVFGCAYCYFFFWLTFGRIKIKHKNTAAFIIALDVLVYILATACILKFGDWWYKSICCFPIGILWGMYEKNIGAFIKKYYAVCLFGSFIFVFGAYFLPAVNNRIFHVEYVHIWLVNDILMGVSFTLLIAVLLYKLYFKNSVTMFFGTVSYEIYLYHGLIMDAIKSVGKWLPVETHLQQELYACMVILITITVVTIFHKINVHIVNSILYRGKK